MNLKTKFDIGDSLFLLKKEENGEYLIYNLIVFGIKINIYKDNFNSGMVQYECPGYHFNIYENDMCSHTLEEAKNHLESIYVDRIKNITVVEKL